MMFTMRRRTLSLALALLTALALCVPALVAAPEQALAATTVSTYAELVAEINSGTDSITITGTITITDTIMVATPVNISGGSLIRSEDRDGSSNPFNGVLFSVTDVLTLTNITIDGNKGNLVDYDVAPMIEVGSGGTLYVESGATLRDNLNSAVQVFTNSNMVMTGGEISGNVNNNTFGSTSASGGGVYNEGAFALSGGVIAGNTSAYGGGVYNANTAVFTLTDTAQIASNTATVSGGGVYNDGRFAMRGGRIEKDVAVNGGGMYNTGTFLMSAGTITNCSASLGGGVYNNGTFTMTGTAAIVENEASDDGGGVYNQQGSSSLDGKIEDNTAINCGNGVFTQAGMVSVLGGGAGDLVDSFGMLIDSNGFYALSGTPIALLFDGATQINPDTFQDEPVPVGTTFRVATTPSPTDAEDWAAKFSPVAPSVYTFFASGSDVWATREADQQQQRETPSIINPNTYGPFGASQFGSVVDGDTGLSGAGNIGGATTGTTGGTAAAPQTARVVASSLNFRSGGSLSAAIIGTLPMNTVVEILSTTADGWANVRLSDGRTGWVSTRYIVSLASAAAGTTVITTANLNMRTGPGVGHSIARVAPRGSVFTLAGVSEDGLWGYVVEGGATLYMSMAYLR